MHRQATIAVMEQARLSPRALGDAQADKRLEILQLVHEHGSISQAARVARVSYKAAWQALHTLSNLAGEPLVDSSVGGAGGGGARITPAGQRLLQAASLLAQARQQVLAQAEDASSLSVVDAPRTSMRNNLVCRVLRIEAPDPRDPQLRVVLQLPGVDQELAAVVTRESAQLLDLRVGASVLVLSKATAVRIEAGAAGRLSGQGAELALGGKVVRVARGHSSDELTLRLDGGQELVGFAQRPNRLRSGSRATAWLDERVLVLARSD